MFKMLVCFEIWVWIIVKFIIIILNLFFLLGWVLGLWKDFNIILNSYNMRMMYDLVYVYLGNFVLFKFLKDVVFFWMIENLSILLLKEILFLFFWVYL